MSKLKGIVIFIVAGLLILLCGWLVFHIEESTVEKQLEPFTSKKVDVYTPLPNSVVKSPLEVTGEARGWYFEASFPVKITDANGVVLGQTAAEAQGNWMTTSSVPFKAMLEFSTSTTPTGFLVLQKDNPSDMRQYDESVQFPVRFKAR